MSKVARLAAATLGLLALAADPINDVLGKPAYGGVMDGAGPTIVNGMVYVHFGYAGRSTANIYDLKGKEGNLLIAFSVDGK